MTKLGAGPLGYRDWQRVVNWDGPALVNQVATLQKGSFTTGLLDVSRFGYLSGRMGVGENPVILTLEYFLDEAGTLPCGERKITLHPEIGFVAQPRTPNLGPWLRIKVNAALGGTLFTLTALLFPTNRYSPVELIPQRTVLLAQTVAFAGAESKLIYPLDYFAGPVQVRLFSKEVSVAFVDIEAQTSAAIFTPIDRVVANAATLTIQRVVTPLGAWRCNLQSTGAVTAELVLAPFTTGSS